MLTTLLSQATEAEDIEMIIGTATTDLTGLDVGAAAAATAAGGLFVGGMLVLIIIASIIGIIFLVWWIIQIIDLSSRDFPQKSTWLILMIASLFLGLNWIMSIVYHFSITKKGIGKKATA